LSGVIDLSSATASASGTASPSFKGAKPAGFFIRAIAASLDLAVLLALTWALALLLIHSRNPTDEQDQVVTIFLVVSALYTVAFNMKWGATPGKLLLRLRVVRMSDGSFVRWHQALARWASYLISASIFGAGFLMAAFHPLKRTIHDLMAGTRVVHAPKISGQLDK
jgi:uncharacterized RDD family membrane protein YckC